MFGQSQINKHTDDSDLFRMIQKGNKEAFTLVYEKYNKILYVLAFRYLKDKAMTEDAIQQVFTKLWEYHADIVVSISLKNYLYTMTKNHILNQIRDANNVLIQNHRIAQSIENYEDNLFETIEEKELMTIFYRAIALLPDQKKIVCKLKMEEKFSNQEIAEKMKISINTVKTHYAQAIKLLRVYMQKMLIFIVYIILS